jgi:hypothetical protein
LPVEHAVPDVQPVQAPFKHTSPVPQLVPFARSPDAVHTGAPVAHETVPSVQGFPVLHEALATQETHDPLSQTSFVPQAVPLATLPVDAQIATPEVHDVVPSWQVLPAGVQAAPGLHPEASSPPPSSKLTVTVPCTLGTKFSVRFTGGVAATTATTGALTQVGVADAMAEQSTANASPVNVSVPSGRPLRGRAVDSPGVMLNESLTVWPPPLTVISMQLTPAGACAMAAVACPTFSGARVEEEQATRPNVANVATSSPRLNIFWSIEVLLFSLVGGMGWPSRASGTDLGLVPSPPWPARYGQTKAPVMSPFELHPWIEDRRS